MDIRHLKTFVAIADYGTFGAAGEAVFLSQSAVSQHVRIIEEFLGFKIFDRTVRPPALTAPGAVLLEGARKIVKEYDSITRNLTGDGLSGRLSLGTIRASFKGALPKALAILRHRYPQLRIHVQTAVSTDLIPSVESGRLDAAIIPSGTTVKKNLCWLPYTNESLVVVADINTKGNTDIELLENSPYIKYFSHSTAAIMIDKEFLRRDIQVNSRIDIDALEPIIRMVEHGHGVSVLPEPVGGEPFPPNIRKIPFGDPPLKRQLGIIYQKSSTKEKIISVLHNELFKLSGSPDFNGI
jgi:DNA-binding transcriptional LysR family regulator